MLKIVHMFHSSLQMHSLKPYYLDGGVMKETEALALEARAMFVGQPVI